MVGRSRDEEGRSATPLELFFDLVFVVAVAFAAAAMHHDVVEGVVGESIVRYLQVFFAIWWAWMNFTWFASAYDTDDVIYRLLTMVQMFGVLVLAAGVPAGRVVEVDVPGQHSRRPGVPEALTGAGFPIESRDDQSDDVVLDVELTIFQSRPIRYSIETCRPASPDSS